MEIALSPMGQPYWLDEHGQRIATQKCSRPGCGCVYPIRRYRYTTLKQIGWSVYRVARFTSWCGHGQRILPIPDEGEWARLVPILGKAK